MWSASGTSAGTGALRTASAAIAVCILYSGLFQYWHSTHGGPSSLFAVLALLAISVWVLSSEPNRTARFLGSPLLLWVYVYLLVSTIWGIWRSTSGAATDQALLDRYRSMVLVLAMAVVFDDARARSAARIAAVVVALVASVGNVAEELGAVTFVDTLARTAGRAGGLYGNPNQSGFSIVFGLSVGITAVRRSLRIPVLLAGACGVAATLSRGALVCLAVLGIVLVVRKEIGLLPAVLAAAIAGVALAVSGGSIEAWLDAGGALNTDTLARLSMTADDSGRSALARKVWGMFLDSPWVGQGLASENEGRISHNIYISLAAEHGILGLALFPALVFAIIARHSAAVPFAIVFLVAGVFGHGFLEQEAVLVCVALAAAQPPGDPPLIGELDGASSARQSGSPVRPPT